MPLVDLPEPSNCWPYHVDKFTAALIASEAFQSLVGQSAPEDVAGCIFGKRLTHSRSGRVWTREELAELRHYAMVQTETYGKRLGPFGSYQPYGATWLDLYRLVPWGELVDVGAGPEPTDAHEREWQNITGLIVDEVIAAMKEGPTDVVDQVDLINDSSTKVQGASAQGVWQEHIYLFTWSEK